MNAMIKGTAIAVLLSCFFSGKAAFADGVAVFEDEATFISQAGATAQPALPETLGTTSGVPVGDLTFSIGPAATNLIITDFTAISPDREIGLSGTEDLDIDIAAPVFNLGFRFVDPTAGPNSSFDVTLLSGGGVVETFNFAAPKDTLYFVGIATDTEFDRVEIREVGGDSNNEYYGLFYTSAAANRFWTFAGGGNWDTSTNWTGDTTPLAGDNAFITPSVAATVTGPGAATTVGSLTLDNQNAGTTTLNLAAGSLTVANDLVISMLGESALNVGGGTLNVGGQTTINTGGTLTVPGGGTFNPTGAVNLAGGTLSVDALGSLSPNWTAGTLAVTGAAGLAVNLNGPLGGNPVSIDGTKTLDVTNTLTVNSAVIFEVGGGVVNAGNVTAFLGTVNADAGEINVAGTLTNQGTTNLNGAAVVATNVDASAVAINHNDGELVVDGGTYTPFAGANDFELSGEPGSPVLTLDNGATLDVTGTLNLARGADEDGTLNIVGGSAVTAAAVNAGSISFTSDAIINVDGAGATLDIAGNLDLGEGNVTNQDANRGRDQLNVDDGGEVNVAGTVIVNTTGRVNLFDGSITAGGWVRNAESIFTHAGGTLTIDGGDFSSGSSGFNFTGSDRPVIRLINGATHNGVNIDMRNAEWELLSGSSITATTLELFNSTGTGEPTEMVIDASTLTLTGELNVGTNDGDGELTVRNGSAASSSALRIGFAGSGATGTVTIDGPGTTFTAGTLFTGNGSDNNGELIISDGALLTITGAANGNTTIGDDGTGLATVTITGNNGGPSTLDAAGFMWIGGSDNENGGNAIIDIEAGGLMNANGAIVGFGNGGGSDGAGVVNVTGPGSFWNAIAKGTNDLFIGDNGNGTLNVTAGGRVDADALFIGDESGSETALVTIDGGNSTVNVSGLIHVGNGRKGTLELTDGAALNTGLLSATAEARIGNAAGADGSSVLVDNATWTHQATGKFAVGDDSDSTSDAPASLTIRNGGSVSTGGLFFVADQAGATGSVIVDGEGSLLTIGDDVRLGDNGAGTMEIRNGGDVTTAPTAFFEVSAFGGGSGELTVINPGSTLAVGGYLSVGDEGTADGSLLIDDGGVVSTDDDHMYIARVSSSSIGAITVQDLNTADGSNGSQLNSGDGLFIGGNLTNPGGNGTLNVNAGGTVNVTGQLKLYSLATVNLQGGTINADSFDIVTPVEDDSGTFNFISGTFRFTAGATLSNERLGELFNTAPGVAPTLNAGQHLVITDEAALTSALRLNGGELSVGSVFGNDIADLDFDAGTLNITNTPVTIGSGGLLGANPTVEADQTVNVSQTVTVNTGSTLTVVGHFNTGGLTNNGDVAYIDTTGGGKSVNGAVNNPAGSTVTVIGEVTFNDAVSGGGGFFGPGTAIFAGGVSPGDSTATVPYEGNVTLTDASTLFIELGGVTPGALVDGHDQLDIAGDLTLGGGGLNVALLGGFTPQLNQVFDIIEVGGTRAGTFAGLGQNDLVGHYNGIDLFISYTGGDGNDIALITLLPGDVNGDGAVDQDDLDIFAANWLTAGSRFDGDFNGDGFIDVVDLGILATNWQAGVAGAAFADALADVELAVPEPTTLALLGLGALGLARRPRRADHRPKPRQRV